MTNRTREIFLTAIVAAALAGCGGESDEQAQTAPPPRPVVEAPKQVNVQSLIGDKRVQFPQARAPTDESLARAVVGLAEGLASGNEEALRPMLDASARGVLDQLIESGRWSDATGEIEAVRIVSLDQGEEGTTIGLAIQTSKGAYLTGWRATGQRGSWTFGATPTPETTAPTAADLDGAALSG